MREKVIFGLRFVNSVAKTQQKETEIEKSTLLVHFLLDSGIK